MPLTWNISDEDRMVEVVAAGAVGLQDLERYLDTVMVAGALPYAKLLDATKGEVILDENDMMALGARMSVYNGLGPIGPLAIVVASDEARLLARLFITLSASRRPAKIFKTVNGARRWLAAAAAAP